MPWSFVEAVIRVDYVNMITLVSWMFISHTVRYRSNLDPSSTSSKLASSSGTRKGPGRRSSSSSATLILASTATATRAPQHRQHDSQPNMPAGVMAYISQPERSPHERVVSSLINRLKSKVRLWHGLARYSFPSRLLTTCSVSAASMQ